MNASPVVPGLDARLARVLGGEDLEATIDLTLTLATVDAAGYPHAALLSCGEVLHLGGDVLALATWRGSRTTANLLERRRALLSTVVDAEYCTLKREVADAGTLDIGGSMPLRAFRCRVVSTERQSVGYARLVSGITFELAEPQAVMARWQATLAALRGLSRPPDEGSDA